MKSLVTVYTPISPLADPLRLMRDMLRDISASKELAWRLFVRNLSSKYRQTLLGYLWAFLPPIMTTSVFVYLHRVGYFTIGPTNVSYVVFVFAGLILWQVFTDALNAPLRMVQQSFSLLTKVNFPREALIIAGLGEVIFGFLIRAILMFILLVLFGVPLTWSVLGMFVGVIALAALGLAIGLLLTPIALLYHDVGQALPFVLNLWMFLTPVIYPAAQSWSGSLSMLLNPVSPLLDTARAWLFSGTPQYFGGFLFVCGTTAVALMAGWLVYRLALPILIERIAA
ncbi:MAG TPA: ABC transporter permease [Candidatus Binatia bacterium]